MRKCIYIFISVLLYSNLLAQNEGYDYSENIKVLYGTVFNGDTIPVLNVPEIDITGRKFANFKERNMYEYYLKRVKKVYPYYQIAQEVIDEMAYEKENSKKRYFKKYKKSRKKELMNEFEKELRALKVSEGKVLVKMINRDTGINFYDLIKEYNSGFKAWIYNIAANRYDYDLKEEYTTDTEDNRILEIAIKHVLNNNEPAQ